MNLTIYSHYIIERIAKSGATFAENEKQWGHDVQQWHHYGHCDFQLETKRCKIFLVFIFYCLSFWSVCRKMKRIEKKGGSGLGCILQFITVDCYIIEAVIVYLLIAHLLESLMMIFQVKESFSWWFSFTLVDILQKKYKHFFIAK